MERCNLQAMLKLVKLCERYSTNRLRGFDFTARRVLPPTSMISIRRTPERLHNIPAGHAQPYMPVHKLRLEEHPAPPANDTAAALMLLSTRAMRHS